MIPRNEWPPVATLTPAIRAAIDQKHAATSEAADALVRTAVTEILRGGSYVDLWGMMSMHAATVMVALDPCDEHSEAVLLALCAELSLRLAERIAP